MGAESPLLILLLGNRIQPATMLAYHLRPARVACIGSADRPETVAEAASALEYVLGPGRLADSRTVAPYRLDETLAAIERVMAQARGLTPAIGLTGCPLPMSIAGYEAGRRLGCPVLYVNTQGAEIMDFTRPEQSEPLRIHFQKLDDYLAICGLAVMAKREPVYASTPAGRRAAAQLLGQAGDVGIRLIAALRAAGLVQRGAGLLRLEPLDAEPYRLLRRLAETGIVANPIKHLDGSVSCRMPAAGETAFLNGDWLEEYVWGVAEALRSHEPALFDVAGQGVKFRSGTAEREGDFIALRGGTPLIASCKSGADPWKKDDLDELAAVAHLLGGNYVTRLFIAHQNPPSPSLSAAVPDPYEQFKEQARRLRIVLVTGRDLGRLAEVLCKELLDPTFKPV
ncbi:MAG: DUF1887 family CARF protein [Anaerolineae bacterium]|nr:DUF1887 family CARF protein [Anaerolineae bacterium]